MSSEKGKRPNCGDGEQTNHQRVNETMNMGLDRAINSFGPGMCGDTMPLECFVAYEDLPTGLRAKRVLDRVLKISGDGVSPRMQLLRFDLLGHRELHYWAAREAGQADLVVLSSHGQSELPEPVKAWLDLWLCRKRGRPSALVASLDEPVRQNSEANPTIAYLHNLAAQSDLALFLHFGGMSATAARLAIQCIRKRLRGNDRRTRSEKPTSRGHDLNRGINE